MAERIAQGPIPLEEALLLAKQIAEALEYAHERGVVHRDLKPANIKITPEGVVKVLDFGLAKVAEPVALATDADNSPTLSKRATEVGVIMGTAAYMSPEQARGGVVDKRADIWAFGVVLYEMLTGRPLFAGPTVSDTLAAVLRHEPNYEQVPLRVRRLIQRCLEKDPKKRLRDVGDAMPLLEDAPAVAMPTSKNKLAWAVAGALAIVAAVALWALSRAARPSAENTLLPLTRLSVDLGPDAMTGINLTAAISPDGRRLVFPARAANGKPQLATRLLDQVQTSLLPGTENGSDPFFLPTANGSDSSRVESSRKSPAWVEHR
jgi:serine/threonine protein kinase